MKNNGAVDRQQEQLFREHYPRLYYYAIDWLEDEAAAREVVGHLFAHLWRKHADWRPISARRYLYHCMRHRCIDYLKRHDTEHSRMLQKDAFIASNPQLHEKHMHSMEQALKELNPKTRFILEQCYVEGKGHDELARLMSTSTATIHHHICLAVDTFRKTLAVAQAQSATEPVA